MRYIIIIIIQCGNNSTCHEDFDRTLCCPLLLSTEGCVRMRRTGSIIEVVQRFKLGKESVTFRGGQNLRER